MTNRFCDVEVGFFHPKPEFRPVQMTAGSSGFDLRVWHPTQTEFSVEAGKTLLVPTGLRIVIPRGFEAQIRMRSGLARRGAFFIPNSPSTVDSDYRGEVFVLVYALRDVSFYEGDRIAQLVVAPVVVPGSGQYNAVIKYLASIEDAPETERGNAGFGSTGTR